MDQLSTELLTLVFKGLHYKQKVECMRVCTRWANVLRGGLDVETLIFPDKAPHEPFFKKLESGCYGCKKLLIIRGQDYCFSGNHCVDFEQLATQLPNLTHLFFNGTDKDLHSQWAMANVYQNNRLQSWRNKLKTIEMFFAGRNCLSILSSGVFHSLTTLTLGPLLCDQKVFDALLNALKNMPQLENLTFKYGYLDIWDLDRLHKSSPNLKSLTLKTSIVDDRQKKPFDILPMVHLKTLKIPAPASFFFRKPTAMQYFIKKYSGIQHFSFGALGFRYREHNDRLVNETFALLQQIGHNLTHVEIDGPCKKLEFADTFASMNLDYLSVNVGLSKPFSRKLLSLNGLRNLGTLKLKDVPPLDDYSVFRPFTELKVLELEFKEKKGLKPSIAFNRLVYFCLPNKLVSLALSYAQLVYSPAKYDKSTDCGIKQLKLKRSEIAANLDTYMNKHLKKLHTLYLHSCKIGHVIRGIEWSRPKNQMINFFKLPDRRLSLLDIELYSDYSYSTTGYSYSEVYFIPRDLKLVVDNNTHYFQHQDSSPHSNTTGNGWRKIHP